MATAVKARKARKATTKKAVRKQVPARPAKKATSQTKRVPNAAVAALEPIGKMKLAAGISAYLEEVRESPVGNGRQTMSRRRPETIRHVIATVEARLPEATSILGELKLRARLVGLRDALDTATGVGGERAVDFFEAHGAEYAEKNGIPYQAFRDMGVPASVLKRAGINA